MLSCLRTATQVAIMHNSVDLYLGTFLILCGFALSLFNFRRVVKGSVAYSTVLLSENIILTCIGIAYVSRSVYRLSPANVDHLSDMEQRAADIPLVADGDIDCGFRMLLLAYGPLVVSMVNSFSTLIVDNYMHYKILRQQKEKIDENVVRDIEDDDTERKLDFNMCNICHKYMSSVTIALQWIVPIVTALAMYPINVKEISVSQVRTMDNSCIAMLDLNRDGCTLPDTTNYTLDLPKYIQSPVNFFEIQEDDITTNYTNQADTVLSSVLRIINNFNNNTNFNYAAMKTRTPKMEQTCMKMCYMDNKTLLLYMFLLGFVSYFIPITISTIIITKIHAMEVEKPKMKVYATRELLYNILFWTPVMFDTFLSLILCSYSMHGMRTSMFNVIANVYQAVKNFMNTKYIKDNVIVPI